MNEDGRPGFADAIKAAADPAHGELLESAPDAIVSVDAKGTIVFTNASAERLFGYSKEEMVGSQSELLVPPRLRGAFREAHDGLISGALAPASRATMILQRKDGSELGTEVALAVAGSGGDARIVSVTRDMTDRRRRERSERVQQRRLSGAFHEAPIAMCLCSVDRDSAGRFIGVNQAFCELTGYTEEQLLDRSFQAITHPDDLEQGVEVLRALMAGERDTAHVVKRYLRPDGSSVWADVKLSIVRDPDGEPQFCVAQTLDITERRHEEQALRNAEREMTDAFEHGPLGMVLATVEGGLVRANQAFCRMTGYEERELVGYHARMLAHEAEVGDILARVRSLAAGEITAVEDEFRYIKADGSTGWVQVSASLVRAEQGGAPQYLIAQLQEITDRREAQEELVRALSIHAATIESTTDGLLVVDNDGRIISFNGLFVEMWGIPSEILEARDDDRAIAFVLDQLIDPDEFLGKVRELYGQPTAESHDVLNFKDGRIFERYSKPHLIDGEPAGRVWSFRDVTTLQEAQQRLRSAFEDAPIGIGLISVDRESAGRILQVNPALCEMLGRSEEELLATDMQSITHPEDVESSMENIRQLVAGEVSRYSHEKRYLRGDGQVVWGRVSASMVRDASGKPLYAIGQIEDITERTRAEQNRRETEARYRSLVERLPAITYITEPQTGGNWLYVSPQIQSILGYSAEEWKQDSGSWMRLIHPDDREAAAEADRKCTETGEFSLDYRMFTRDGKLLWFHDRGTLISGPDGRGTVLHGVMLDVTERKRSEERVAFLAYHDELTGLPNRTMFQQHLELAVARARRHERAVAVLYMDLDRFKLVNDSFGHAPGDELLRQIADRLRGVTRADDLVARLSGDEFLVMLADIDPELVGDQASGKIARGAETVAAKIHEALQTPFVVEGEEFYVDASIGIGVFPSDANDADELIRQADMAMYESKRLGQGGTRRFARTGDRDPAAQLSLASRLRRATDHGEFMLLYQPIVDLDTCEMGGVEALIRWRDPKRGAVMPMEFIPLAEETGLIEEIGDWVIAEVCEQAAAWARAGIKLRTAFNVSLRQLRKPDFARRVMELADAAGAKPRRLVAEITESAVMRDPGQARETFDRLHDYGVWTAIDDFGTGHSSLSRLMEVPVSALKIDRSFVSGVPDDRASAAMVAGIVQIAKGLDLMPVAEGIETEEQRRYLMEVGCTRGQGFRFSRPVPPDQIEFLYQQGPLGPPARPIARRRPRRGRRRIAQAAKRPGA